MTSDGGSSVALVLGVWHNVPVDRASWASPWKCKSGKRDSRVVLEQSQCQIKHWADLGPSFRDVVGFCGAT